LRFTSFLTLGCRGALAAAGLALALSVLTPVASRAQTIVLSVNGDPITTLDIEQRMKLLRVLHKPASREAAVEDLIVERLKTHEISKYTIKLGDSDVAEEVGREARELKVAPGALVAEIDRAGISQTHYKGYFQSVMGYNLLIQALNKGVEASEVQVRAELAKDAGKVGLQYTLRQVILSLPTPATPAQYQARMKDAEALRGRFAGCEAGVPMARETPDVAVLDPLYRNSNQLAEQFRNLLEKTPVGHLTLPERGPSGIEMIAVCDKAPSKDDSVARAEISNRLMRARLEADAAARIKDMRDHAIIVKMNGGALTER
jgi:peptidyl-prolyl cis-trans isomerase SurA